MPHHRKDGLRGFFWPRQRYPAEAALRRVQAALRSAVPGKSGSANAQAVLRGVLGRTGAIVVPDPQALVPRASRLFDEQVDMCDEGTREEIRQLVEAVAHWCRRVQPEGPVSAQPEASL